MARHQTNCPPGQSSGISLGPATVYFPRRPFAVVIRSLIRGAVKMICRFRVRRGLASGSETPGAVSENRSAAATMGEVVAERNYEGPGSAPLRRQGHRSST